MVHLKGDEALTAKLDRGREGRKELVIHKIKENTKLGPTIATV